jgi:hypothetical protein
VRAGRFSRGGPFSRSGSGRGLAASDGSQSGPSQKDLAAFFEFPDPASISFGLAAFRKKVAFRSRSKRTPKRDPRVPCSALRLCQVPWRVPFEANFSGFPFAVPSPKLRFRWTLEESGFGIGLRLCLALLPPVALPSLAGFRPCGPPPFPRGNGGELSNRFRPATLCHDKRCVMALRVAPSGIVLWITRITGITMRPRKPRAGPPELGRRRGGPRNAAGRRGAPAAPRPDRYDEGCAEPSSSAGRRR